MPQRVMPLRHRRIGTMTMQDDGLKQSFPPVEGEDARLLILGSMPGDESLCRREYYAHARNAFWPIMGELLGFDPALPYDERLDLLRRHRIALWDVLASCLRPGSLDSNISVPRPNDLRGLLARHPGLTAVYCNGGASLRYFKRFFPDVFAGPLPVRQLPSTSPAAARLSFADKLAAYREALRLPPVH